MIKKGLILAGMIVAFSLGSFAQTRGRIEGIACFGEQGKISRANGCHPPGRHLADRTRQNGPGTAHDRIRRGCQSARVDCQGTGSGSTPRPWGGDL